MDIDLVQRIQNLPPELFYHIKSEVLQHSLPALAEDGIRYQQVTAAYKYPLLLHLNQTTRQQFAKTYYGSTILVFSSGKLLHNFVMAMDNSHIVEMRGMRAPASIRNDLEDDVCLRLGTKFGLLKVRVSALAGIGEELECLGNERGALVVLRSDDLCQWVDRLRR